MILVTWVLAAIIAVNGDKAVLQGFDEFKSLKECQVAAVQFKEEPFYKQVVCIGVQQQENNV